MLLDQGLAPRAAALLRTDGWNAVHVAEIVLDLGPSVVFIRVEGLGSEGQAARIRRVFETCAEALDQGSAFTVDSRAIRIRKLPLR